MVNGDYGGSLHPRRATRVRLPTIRERVHIPATSITAVSHDQDPQTPPDFADRERVAAEVVAECERRHEMDDARFRIADLAAKAAAQQLSLSRVVAELRTPSGRWVAAALVERLDALRRSPKGRAAVRALAAGLAAQSDTLPLKDQHSVNGLLRALLAWLPRAQARRLACPFIDHRLKERRELGLAVLRRAGVDRTTLLSIVSRYRRTGEERLLKFIIGAPGSASTVDLLDLLPRVTDRYWYMRALQALLIDGRRLPRQLVNSHPTEFLQAIGRARHRPSVSLAKALVRRREMRSNLRVIAFYAWAMYQLGEYREVLRVSKRSIVRAQTAQ